MTLGGINCLENLRNQTPPEVEKVHIFHLCEVSMQNLGRQAHP